MSYVVLIYAYHICRSVSIDLQSDTLTPYVMTFEAQVQGQIGTTGNEVVHSPTKLKCLLHHNVMSWGVLRDNAPPSLGITVSCEWCHMWPGAKSHDMLPTKEHITHKVIFLVRYEYSALEVWTASMTQNERVWFISAAKYDACYRQRKREPQKGLSHLIWFQHCMVSYAFRYSCSWLVPSWRLVYSKWWFGRLVTNGLGNLVGIVAAFLLELLNQLNVLGLSGLGGELFLLSSLLPGVVLGLALTAVLVCRGQGI